MAVTTTLRKAAIGLLGAALVLSAAACSSTADGTDPETQGETSSETATVRVGQWIAGAISTTALTTKLMSENEEILAEHNLDVEFVEFSNLQAQYTDLATGRIDAIVGGPESFASSAAQGAPLSIMGTFSRSNAVVLSTGPELTADNLRGQRLVAPTTTSTWALVREQIRDVTGLEAETDYEVVTADTSNSSLQQLAAGTADFAMAWGEALVDGPNQFPNIKVVADADMLAGDNEPFIQFVIAVNNENIDQEVGERLVAAYADQTAWMEANPDEADAAAVEGGRLEGTSKEMITSGMMNWDIHALPGAEGEELRESLQRAVDAGTLDSMPPNLFFREEG